MQRRKCLAAHQGAPLGGSGRRSCVNVAACKETLPKENQAKICKTLLTESSLRRGGGHHGKRGGEKLVVFSGGVANNTEQGQAHHKKSTKRGL